ncbi:dipeptidase [Ferruginibacter sp.]|nr:dipeptidase [Ferruginibacter sp.]
MQIWKEYLDNNKDRFIAELFSLLRIPSISAKSEHIAHMKECSEKIKFYLLEAGADKVEIYQTAGFPVVYGEKIIDASLPTVLVYGHYDVQPAEPFELWNSDPFEPVIVDDKIFARGSCDDKGQLYMHIKALEILLKTNTLSSNIKFCIEGEEEIGSPNLESFINANKNLLKADAVLISDSAMISFETPSIDIGQRGLVYIELELTGPNRDLHSGIYGGAVANPINILSKMIASLHDENNRIAIPGFYDDVLVSSAEEREKLALAPFNEAAYREELGITNLYGEKDFSTNERTGIRPSIDVNGIWGGYTGEGAKTVLPAKAFAKISVRTVPNQQSKDITALLINHLRDNLPDGVTLKTQSRLGIEPYLTPVESNVYKAAAKAIETSFGKTPVPVRCGGGGIPYLFENGLGIHVVFMGFGFDNDNIHSPNEKFGLENFYKGIETIMHFHKIFKDLNVTK